MKFKFLTILLAIAVALAFTSCDDKHKSSKGKSDKESVEDDEDSSKSSSKSRSDKDDEIDYNECEPTGDPADDAEALTELALDMMDDAESMDELKDANKEWKKVLDGFEKYYEGKSDDEHRTFERELNSYADKMENAYEKAKKRIKDDEASKDDDDI